MKTKNKVLLKVKFEFALRKLKTTTLFTRYDRPTFHLLGRDGRYTRFKKGLFLALDNVVFFNFEIKRILSRQDFLCPKKRSLRRAIVNAREQFSFLF